MKFALEQGATLLMALIAIGAARFLTAAGFEHPGRDCFLAAAAATALTMSIVRSVSGFDRG